MDNNYDNKPGNENEAAPQQDITNQEPAGQETTGQTVTGQESVGQEVAGQESTGQNPAGQEPAAGTSDAQTVNSQTYGPGNTDTPSSDTQKTYTYTDPNADYVQYGTGQQPQYGAGNDQNNPYGAQGGYQDQYGNANSQGYQYGGQSGQNNPYGSSNNQEFNYQDNYNYNVGNNTGYNKPYNNGMDESPMSLGDWVLTILIMTLVPCVGIVLYLVWAFSKNGNVNRRNYCRAYLIITGIALVLVIIFMIVFGIAGLGLSGLYY